MLKQGLKIPGLLWGFLRDCSRVTLRLSGSFRVSIAVLGVGSGLYSCFMEFCGGLSVCWASASKSGFGSTIPCRLEVGVFNKCFGTSIGCCYSFWTPVG